MSEQQRGESALFVRQRFDKRQVAHYFSKAAEHYADFAELQRHTGESLIQQLRPRPAILLDLGCGPGSHSVALSALADTYVAVDLAPAMLLQARLRQPQATLLAADMEQLPFADKSVQCVFANLALQWSNQLRRSIAECQRVLARDGQLLFSLVLADSMQPLLAEMQAIDGQPHGNQQYSWAALQQLLQQFPSMQWHYQQVSLQYHYESVRQMLAAVKGVGANYVARAPMHASYFGKARWLALQQRMEGWRDSQGRLPMHWHIGYVVGYKCLD